MKKIALLSLLFMSCVCFGQKVEKDEVDGFTGKAIKRTSLETVVNHQPLIGEGFIFQVRACKTNNLCYLSVKFMMRSIFSISKEQELMFKLDNDAIVTLNSNDSEVSSKSGDRWIVNLNYKIIDDESLELLLKHKIVKIRIYTTDGYAEREVSGKNQDKIMKCLQLINKK